MRIRTLTAFLALPLFFLLLYHTPEFCIPIALSVVSAIGVWEILNISGIKSKSRVVYIICLLFAVCIPFFEYFCSQMSFYFILFPFTMLLCISNMLESAGIKFEQICVCFFASVVVPYFISGVGRIALLENGVYLTIFPFVLAWCSDTCAYFFGRLFGAHKLCPKISPQKTVEGAVGGLLGTVICTALYGFILQRFFHLSINYFAICSFAFIGAVSAQLGDLIMSFIKRNYAVKDYSGLIPGHGGIMDRFDSVVFVVPLVEMFLYFLPNAITM